MMRNEVWAPASLERRVCTDAEQRLSGPERLLLGLGPQLHPAPWVPSVPGLEALLSGLQASRGLPGSREGARGDSGMWPLQWPAVGQLLLGSSLFGVAPGQGDLGAGMTCPPQSHLPLLTHHVVAPGRHLGGLGGPAGAGSPRAPGTASAEAGDPRQVSCPPSRGLRTGPREVLASGSIRAVTSTHLGRGAQGDEDPGAAPGKLDEGAHRAARARPPGSTAHSQGGVSPTADPGGQSAPDSSPRWSPGPQGRSGSPHRCLGVRPAATPRRHSGSRTHLCTGRAMSVPTLRQVPSHSQPGPGWLVERIRGQQVGQLCGCVLHLQLTVHHGHLGRLDA